MAEQTSFSESERRRYVRLDSVFPVQFRMVSTITGQPLSGWLQGFTSNISKGGICLEVNNLDPELIEAVQNKSARFLLSIEIPLGRNAIKASATVSWFKIMKEYGNRIAVGLNYEQIDQAVNKGLMRLAWTRKLFVPCASVAIVVFGIGFAINAYFNIRLIQDNRALVEELVKILQQSTAAEQKIKEISRDKESLQIKIKTAELRIQALEEEKERKKESGDLIAELNQRIRELSEEKSSLQEQLISLQKKETAVTEELLRLDKSKAALEDLNLDKMCHWLKTRQSSRTGLIKTPEGEGGVKNFAFTYDQALAVQVYAYFGDYERARKTLDFFARKAKKKGGIFFNAYNYNNGQEIEKTAYVGPTLWIGIAALQYGRKSHDMRYLNMAEEIASSVIGLQGPDGGITGGPEIGWKLFEHNLDAYAFFNMLNQITDKTRYSAARDAVLKWIMANVVKHPETPNRRKGDSTIVANTNLWTLVALGPEKLEALGINPDRIMEFAEENFLVEVTYTRPEGRTTKVKGFDFAPNIHAKRGHIVFSEWTAQFVIAYQEMADFCLKKEMISKARSYEQKADQFRAELTRMIISSPSPASRGESCLPYATHDSVFTGHGWVTSRGKTTGSIPGTAYTIFAYYRYNPLELSK